MKIRYELVDKKMLILREQPRKHDGDYLKRLADSLVRGQLQPIGMLKDFTVIWGRGRVLAARSKPEITHLWAAVFDEPVTEREFQRMRAVENFVRNEGSNAEKCKICIEYAKNEPDLTLKQIAADLGVDASLVTRYMALDKCIESVREALSADEITLAAMYEISKLPQEGQAAALDKALGKRKRNEDGEEPAKVKKMQCQMPSGAVVTLARKGDGLTLFEVIEELATLLKKARRAAEQGLDCKTFSAVLRDEAKAS